jgi:hypothetical protein
MGSPPAAHLFPLGDIIKNVILNAYDGKLDALLSHERNLPFRHGILH